MSASHEQMDLIASSGMDHVSYILIVYSMSTILFLLVHVLITVYDRAMPATHPAPAGLDVSRNRDHVRDAEQFELGELASDDDEDEVEGLMKKQGHSLSSSDDGTSSSPSTLGRNHERVAL